MNEFGFNNMSDDEFRREFMRLLNMYQSGMDNFMKEMYGSFEFPVRENRNPYTPMSEEEFLRKYFGDIPSGSTNGTYDDGSNWEKRSWTSPDGSRSYRSFRRSFTSPMEGKTSQNEDISNVDTLKLLETKLNKAIIDEKYEDAAKIRDLINSLKNDQK